VGLEFLEERKPSCPYRDSNPGLYSPLSRRDRIYIGERLEMIKRNWRRQETSQWELEK